MVYEVIRYHCGICRTGYAKHAEAAKCQDLAHRSRSVAPLRFKRSPNGSGPAEQPARPWETPETCIACSIPFKDGDRVLNDTSGGALHAACCGPERESYTNADGGPLGPGDPIPEGYLWRPWAKRAVGA